jgi:hypothetical protein
VITKQLKLYFNNSLRIPTLSLEKVNLTASWTKFFPSRQFCTSYCRWCCDRCSPPSLLHFFNCRWRSDNSAGGASSNWVKTIELDRQSLYERLPALLHTMISAAGNLLRSYSFPFSNWKVYATTATFRFQARRQTFLGYGEMLDTESIAIYLYG